MKKNLGNGIVKKSIIVAMSFMLIATSPVANVIAAEATETTEETTDGTESIEFELTKEEEDFVNDLADTLDKVANGYNDPESSAYRDEKKVIDEVCDTVETEVTEALDEKIDEAGDVAEEAESVADSLVETAEKVEANIDNYKKTTDELLNEDQEIVASVEGNTDNIVETITKDGDVLLNVEDENGEQMKVQDYTESKAEAAKDAVAEAQDILDNLTTSSNVEEERAKIDEAVATAEAAKADAETAYNAAKSVLVEEIKRYNAYATKYGYDLYEYTDENGVTSTPAYTDEELAGLSDFTMTQNDIENGLDAINNATWEVQTEKIESAQHAVEACGIAVNMADDVIKKFEDAEDKLLANLESMMAQSENAMNSATSSEMKDTYQAMYDSAKALYDVYTKGDETTQESYQAIFNYADESANKLADTVEQAVVNANNNLYGENGAVTRYNAALEEYNAIKAEYDNFVAGKNTVDANFDALKEKLANAEAAVHAAQEDVVIAIEEVNKANDIKKQFEETVKPEPEKDSDSESDNNNGSNNSSSNTNPSTGSSTNATTANGNTNSSSTLTLEDVITPLTAGVADEQATTTIADEQTPLTAAIVDEATPLADAVPKTGDASAAAGAVGASGLAAMVGALFLNLKKRTLR